MRKREIERQRETVLVICPVKHIGSPQDEQEREREERERERERERWMGQIYVMIHRKRNTSITIKSNCSRFPIQSVLLKSRREICFPRF